MPLQNVAIKSRKPDCVTFGRLQLWSQILWKTTWYYEILGKTGNWLLEYQYFQIKYYIYQFYQWPNSNRKEMDGWIDGWLYGWMDGQMGIYCHIRPMCINYWGEKNHLSDFQEVNVQLLIKCHLWSAQSNFIICHLMTLEQLVRKTYHSTLISGWLLFNLSQHKSISLIPVLLKYYFKAVVMFNSKYTFHRKEKDKDDAFGSLDWFVVICYQRVRNHLVEAAF